MASTIPTMPTLPDNFKEPTDGTTNPWDEFGRPFTGEEEIEIRLYCCGVLERTPSEKTRVQAFRKIVKLRCQMIDDPLLKSLFNEAYGNLRGLLPMEEELTSRPDREEHMFDRLVDEQKEELRHSFQHQLWHQGIETTRRLMIPAYTFDKFFELPLELRRKIWSYGARHEDPKTHKLGHPFVTNAFSSFVSMEKSYCPSQSPPAILHVCKESRVGAQKMFSLLPYTVVREGSMVQKYGYFNVLYDNFHITSVWYESAILLFLFLRFGTTRPLYESMVHCIDSAQNLRIITVDFGIFKEVPVKYWFEFTRLETLAISIHNECEELKNSRRRPQRESRHASTPLETVEFINPPSTTHDGKRAELVLGRVTKVFLDFIKQNPKLECPKIEVVVQRCPVGKGLGDEDIDVGKVVYGWDLEKGPFASNISARWLTELKDIPLVPWLREYVGRACPLEEEHEEDVACNCLGTFAPELDLSTMGYYSLI